MSWTVKSNVFFVRGKRYIQSQWEERQRDHRVWEEEEVIPFGLDLPLSPVRDQGGRKVELQAHDPASSPFPFGDAALELVL